MIPKDVWINNIVNVLKELASEEYQIKGWVKNEIHDYCTYDKTEGRFLYDSDIEGFFKHAKEFGFSDDQITKIDAVRKAFETFSDEYSGYEDPIIIISDPQWHEIRKLAKKALDSLGITHYLDPSKSIFKDSLLLRLFWFSDPQHQLEFWITKKQPNSNPFQEAVSDFFTKFRLDEIIKNYRDYELTDDQVYKLKAFCKNLDAYQKKNQNEQDIQKILKDSEWHHIQELAKELVTLFNYKPL